MRRDDQGQLGAAVLVPNESPGHKREDKSTNRYGLQLKPYTFRTPLSDSIFGSSIGFRAHEDGQIKKSIGLSIKTLYISNTFLRFDFWFRRKPQAQKGGKTNESIGFAIKALYISNASLRFDFWLLQRVPVP